MAEATDAAQQGGGAEQQQEQQEQKTLTQADVDRIIKDRIQRVEAKYADYNDLKARAEGAKTVEQKLAELESKHAEAEARALRSDIAAKHGITPELRDKFLTGSTAEALEDQAKSLAELSAATKKNGNVARKEGRPVNTNLSPKDAAKREWLASLNGGDA